MVFVWDPKGVICRLFTFPDVVGYLGVFTYSHFCFFSIHPLAYVLYQFINQRPYNIIRFLVIEKKVPTNRCKAVLLWNNSTLKYMTASFLFSSIRAFILLYALQAICPEKWRDSFSFGALYIDWKKICIITLWAQAKNNVLDRRLNFRIRKSI